MRKLLILLSILLIHNSSYSQKRENVTTELNIVLSSEIGDAIVSKGEVISTAAVKITDSFELQSGFIKFLHSKGTVYPYMFSKKGYDFYFLETSLKDGRYWGIAINTNNSNEVFPALISSVKIAKVVKKEPLINKTEIIELITSCDDCYKQELLYTGKTGNIIKFTYREYIGNLARPSFFQDLEYDIQESDTIGFKGLRIKVLNTTNTGIGYEVISTFSSLN
ncbi:MAG: hypothetical protein AB9888_02160 [Bacteroidales bacterium]